MKVNQTQTPANANVSSDVAAKKTQKNRTTGAAAESAQANAARENGAAKTEISSRAKDMAKAKSVASQAPDMREEKIADIKRRIAEGRYQVDPKAVADKMVDEHLSTASMG